MSMILMVYLGVGVLDVIISIPLILGRIPPNRWVGVRVKRTLENKEIWYLANTYAGKWLCGTGLWVIFMAFALKDIQHISLTAYALGVLVVLVLILGVGTNQVLRYTQAL